MSRPSSQSAWVSQGREPGKRTSFHSFVYDQQSLPLHHLVPLASERRVQPHPPEQTTAESGRPTESGIYEPYFSFIKASADSGVESISEENLSVSEGSDDSDLEYPATMTLEKSSFRESISFGVVEPVPKTRCLSVSQQQTEPRMKEAVRFGPGLKPVSYQNRMTVSVKSTWKRFKSTVNYEPKIKPIGYSSTCFLRPCFIAQRFVSLLDYRTDEEMKWYQCTVELRPTTYSSSKVGCFEMNNNELLEEQADHDSDDSEGGPDVSVFLDDGMVSPHIVNAKVWDYRDAHTAPGAASTRLGSAITEPRVHRASMVVNGASPAQRNSQHKRNGHIDDHPECHQNGRVHNVADYSDQQFVEGEGELVSFTDVTDIIDDSEYGTTSGQFEFVQGQELNGYVNGNQGSTDYQGVNSGLDKYVQLNGYGGSSGSLEEIDL